MPIKQFVKEHTELPKVLKSDNKSKRIKEANKQAQELKEIKSKYKI